ncbi:MAG TPA: hypothetical protein VI111_01475 [Thermoleophilaceae bacterium]
MTDHEPTSAPDSPTETAAAPPAAVTPPPAYEPPPVGQSPLSVGAQGDAFDERPELFVAGAFVGGLVFAQVLRKLSSS